MTKEERKEAIDALRISAPIMALTHEEFSNYIKSLNKIVDMMDSIEEIEEVINGDVDAETKCKMIYNILTSKPHYFKKQEPQERSSKHD